MTDLNTLIIFATVVDANSFSEAARRLKMPVSTVSRRIAELEAQLGVGLLERSTRNLRLTDIGAEILAQARRGREVADAVTSIISDQRDCVTGTLRLTSPPSIADTLMSPLLNAFQLSYPQVRVTMFVTERYVDHVAEGVDLAIRIGELRDSALIAHRLLSYRRQLVAAPAYLARQGIPRTPQELAGHRLLSFAQWTPVSEWSLHPASGGPPAILVVEPHLSMNDFAGLAVSLADGSGIGELPPIVRPDLLREGKLVEVLPEWRFRAHDLCMVHVGKRHLPRCVRVFKEFALNMAPKLFPSLPT